MNYIISMMGPLLEGSLVTIKLFFITLLLSIPLGLLFAIFRISKITLLNKTINVYIWIMRGTPLMLQILFIYFALPKIGITMADFPTVVVAFALNYAAYFAEIFRAGIQSINKGQYEASKTLGLSYIQTMKRIIFPQMIKKVLPPLSNEAITLVKDTSLIYILALNDLLRTARNIVQRDFDLTAFFVAALFYLFMTLILTWIFQYMEKRYAVYED